MTTTTTTITQADTHHTATIERYRADLTSGTVFQRHATSNNSYIGYRPCTSRTDVSTLLVRLGRFAGTSNEATQLVAAILAKLHIYGCREEMYAKAYKAAAEAVQAGYVDVAALASPEPPRRSTAERAYSLSTLLELLATLEGDKIGWVDAILRAELGMPTALSA